MPKTTLKCAFERFTEPLPNDTAAMATFRSISRWDKHNFNASSQCFVSNKDSEVEECPRIRKSPFLLAPRLSISSFPNPAQVLQSNSRLSTQGSTDKVFTDHMIDVPLKASFLEGGFAGEASPANTPPRQPFQKPSTISPLYFLCLS